MAEVLRGHYIGDVCSANTTYMGKVKEYPDIIKACYTIGYEAFEKMNMVTSKVKLGE